MRLAALHHPTWWAAAIGAAMGVGPPARAAEPTLRIEILGAGRYVAADVGTNAHDAGPGTTADVGATGRGQFVERGTRLTVTYCDHVGIRFRAPGVPASRPVPITVEVRHPPVPFPDGMHDRDTWRTTVDTRPRTLGVTFEEEGMMQPGTWTISVLRNGRVLATQAFEISIPPDIGQEPETCSPKVS